MCVTSPPYYGLRDYGTANWVGGDEKCDHVEKTNKQGGEADRPHHSEEKFQYKNICHKCGAIRQDKQIGLEETPELYIEKLVEVFREVKRVLKDDGTLWLNLGDSYFHTIKNDRNGLSSGKVSRNEKFIRINQKIKSEYLKPKDLIGIPWRVAFALQADGWYLRQDIIWHKPNPMPESVTDRCTKSHEYIFLLAKNQKYYFDNEAIKEPQRIGKWRPRDAKILHPNSGRAVPSNRAGDNEDGMRNKRSVWTVDNKYQNKETESQFRQGMHRGRGDGIVEKRNLPIQKDFVDKLRANFIVNKLVKKTGLPKTHIEHWFRYDESGFAYPSKEDWEKVGSNLFPELLEVFYESDAIDKNFDGKRNKRSIWTITTKPFKEAHFATFPEDLVKSCILAGCPKGGIVMDCFMGAGTTALVALKLNRKSIGIELNPKYIEIANKRIKPFMEQKRLGD
jgi:DNA modification methylase